MAATHPESSPTKQPFDVATAIRRIREAVKPYPKAALFELAAEGHDSVFEILVACIISIRTRDEVTLPTSRRLFTRAATPAAVAKLTPKEIDALIGDSTQRTTSARHPQPPRPPRLLTLFPRVGARIMTVLPLPRTSSRTQKRGGVPRRF